MSHFARMIPNYNLPHTGRPNQPASVGQYLTGNIPHPVTRPQEVTVEYLRAQLDSGRFDGTHDLGPRPRDWAELVAMHPLIRNQPNPAVQPHPATSAVLPSASPVPTPTPPAVKKLQVNFHVPPRKQGDQPRIVSQEYDPENVPEDFLERARKALGVKEGEMDDLSWKDCDEKAKGWHDLRSLGCPVGVQRQKDVYLDITDRYPESEAARNKETGKKKKDTPSASETGCDQEFRRAKGKLFCQEHSKAGLRAEDPGAVFFYIKRHGEHKSIMLPLVALWARLTHENKAPDNDYINTPEELSFDQLNSNAQSSFAPPASRNRRQNSEVHIHIDEGFIRELRGNAGRESKKRKRAASVGPDSDDEVIVVEEGKENPSPRRASFEDMHIDKILEHVDKKYPALNYHQYRPKFVAEGILYGVSIYSFERQFFVDDIGMPRGAVEPLLYELQYDKKRFRREPLHVAKGKNN
ncbi:hypothetical protein V5O48_018602 [Marasmius crinis-equi]|uniref:Uncharacterized protein n=1 Tax=Marasmius crinis-equi TaxID=585013 RepID=A0ABR3EKW3_9AGAR